MPPYDGPFRTYSTPLRLVRWVVRRARLAAARVKALGRLRYGQNISIGPGARLRIPEFMRIANDVSIGADFVAEANLDIGTGCLVSSRVSIVGNDHRLDVPGVSAYWSGRNAPSTVILEGDNFIGYGVTIVGSVRIGRGAVVGAGAIVVEDLQPNGVYVGVPARFVRWRYSDSFVHT